MKSSLSSTTSSSSTSSSTSSSSTSSSSTSSSSSSSTSSTTSSSSSMSSQNHSAKRLNQYTPNDVYNYASNGNIKGLICALMRDYNLTNWYRDKIGATACHIAIWNNHIHCVYILLEKGYDINYKRFDGTTAFHLAVELGREKIVELFLEKYPNIINDMDGNGNIAIHLAAMAPSNSEKIVDMLLKKNFDINSINNYFETAIYLAAERDNEKSVEILFERNADISIMSIDGKTPYHLIAMQGYYDLFVKILDKNIIDINIKTNDNETSLHLAVNRNNNYVVELLLERGIEIDDNIDKYAPEENDDIDFRPIIFAEVENRRKRKIFDSFINHYIEYIPYIQKIYTRCYPNNSLQVFKPSIGWISAEAIRDKYYFDEIFLYLDIYLAKFYNKNQPGTKISSLKCSNSNNKTYLLMIILSDQLKKFLKPNQNLGIEVSYEII